MIMINTFMTSGFGLTQELPHSFRPAFREARAGTSAQGVPRETHQLRSVFFGKTMGKPWETHYFRGKLWENYGKTSDNSMIIACFLFFFRFQLEPELGPLSKNHWIHFPKLSASLHRGPSTRYVLDLSLVLVKDPGRSSCWCHWTLNWQLPDFCDDWCGQDGGIAALQQVMERQGEVEGHKTVNLAQHSDTGHGWWRRWTRW